MDLNIYFSILFLSTVVLSCDCLKFFVIADWGGLPIFPYKTFVEMNIGREMADIADKEKPDFVLALGDNFYFKGVESVDDLRFKQTFETAFNYSSLNIPWYLIAGNHDHYGNVSAQVLYSMKSTRWNFPDFYYQKTFQITPERSVNFIMIDTVILCGNTPIKRDSSPPLLDASLKYQSEDHWLWLESALKSSKSDFLFVCGHYPVYSIAGHGSTKCLVDRLRPLLEKYGVHAYFSGHDHNVQHVQEKSDNRTMDYFVSGATNFVDPSEENKHTIPPDSLLFHWGNPFSLGAFMFVELNAENMTTTFLSSFGKEMYSYTKKVVL